MATTPSTVELPRHLDPRPTARASTTWSREHRTLLAVLAVVAVLLLALGVALADGSLPSLLANWMWRPA